jgi:homoserine kinase type II
MTTPEVAMLWESAEPVGELARRFGFASAEGAAVWLTSAVRQTHGLELESVDRLLLSAVNLLATASTRDGPVLVKCCALIDAHGPLLALGELIWWLDREGIPVSAPLSSRTGSAQVLHEHLTFNVQRVVDGTMLDASDEVQVSEAGATLADLQDALARYPVPTPFLNRRLVRLDVDLSSTPEPFAGPAARLSERMRDQPSRRPRTQLIHNDFRAANILVAANRVVAVLDFEELAGNDPLEELARSAAYLATLFRNWGPTTFACQQAFIAGYRSRRSLSTEEVPWLPLLTLKHTFGLAAAAAGSPNEAAWTESVAELVEAAGLD